MKNLIKQALDEVYKVAEDLTPEKMTISKTVSIEEVEPVELKQSMEENNVPDSAYFHIQTIESFTFTPDIELYLCWREEVDATKEYKEQQKRKAFKTRHFKAVYNAMTSNGYRRIGCSSAMFKKFDNTTAYDMYVEKDFDRLVEYYSLRFAKEIEKGE